MSVPKRLAIKLQEALGHDAAEDLVTLFDEIRTEQRGLRLDVAELRASVTESRQEMRAMEARLSEKLQNSIGASTVELAKAIAAVDKRIDEKHAELIKWSFLFWVGAVGAIAALAGAFRG